MNGEKTVTSRYITRITPITERMNHHTRERLDFLARSCASKKFIYGKRGRSELHLRSLALDG